MHIFSHIFSKHSFLYLLFGIVFLHTCLIMPLYAADDLDDKFDKLKKLEKKENELREDIDQKVKEEHIILKQVEHLETQSAVLEKDITKNEEEIVEIGSHISDMKEKISQKSTAIDLQTDLLQTMLRNQYESLSHDQQINTVFPSAPTNTFIGNDRREQIATRMHDIVTLIIEERASLEVNKDELEQKKVAIKDAQFELKERNDRLESTKNYKTVLAAQTSAEKENYKDALDDVLTEQLAIQSEIDALSTTQIGNFSLADLPDKDEADLERPVKKPYIVTQGYGKTSFSQHYKGGYHNGIDYVAKGDQKIIAASDGKVLATGNMGRYGYGKWVAIDHDNGLVSLYGHLSKISTSKGKKVDQGDNIGTMGSTGFSTGPHLHFTLFASSTFRVVESSTVSGVYIPTGGTINPALYL